MNDYDDGYVIKSIYRDSPEFAVTQDDVQYIIEQLVENGCDPDDIEVLRCKTANVTIETKIEVTFHD